MSIPDDVYRLRLTEFQTQSKQMTTSTANFQWTVPASTRCLYMFLQDASAGSNPIIPPSVFRVYGTSAGTGVAPTAANEEQNLTTIQVTYANLTKPQTRWDSSFLANGKFLTQLYMQSLIENNQDEDLGGAETMDQWLQRGPLFCWRFERDSEDRSTEADADQLHDGGASGLADRELVPVRGVHSGDRDHFRERPHHQRQSIERAGTETEARSARKNFLCLIRLHTLDVFTPGLALQLSGSRTPPTVCTLRIELACVLHTTHLRMGKACH